MNVLTFPHGHLHNVFTKSATQYHASQTTFLAGAMNTHEVAPAVAMDLSRLFDARAGILQRAERMMDLQRVLGQHGFACDILHYQAPPGEDVDMELCDRITPFWFRLGERVWDDRGARVDRATLLATPYQLFDGNDYMLTQTMVLYIKALAHHYQKTFFLPMQDSEMQNESLPRKVAALVAETLHDRTGDAKSSHSESGRL